MPFSLPLSSLVFYEAEATSKWSWAACDPKVHDDYILDIKILYGVDGLVYYPEETEDGIFVFRPKWEDNQEEEGKNNDENLTLLLYQHHN
jgi:hypothetical protein